MIEEAGLTPGDDPDELTDAINALISAAGGLDTNAGDLRYLRRALNLSDLANVVNARNNLSVYSRSQSDGRYLRLAQNLADVANAATARGNLAAAPLASPLFTGNPRAPTPPAGDNDTSIANTGNVGCGRAVRLNARSPSGWTASQSGGAGVNLTGVHATGRDLRFRRQATGLSARLRSLRSILAVGHSLHPAPSYLNGPLPPHIRPRCRGNLTPSSMQFGEGHPPGWNALASGFRPNGAVDHAAGA